MKREKQIFIKYFEPIATTESTEMFKGDAFENMKLYILKNDKTLLAINALALLIPLISLGGLIKGYYAGIQRLLRIPCQRA